MGDLKVMTVRELAAHIAGQINLEDVLKTELPICDFGIIDTDGETEFDQEELELLHSGVCGWYGIKKIDAGFNSTNLVLVADYYGGGCAYLADIFSGIGILEAAYDIGQVILNSLRVQEAAYNETLLLVEFGGGDK